MSEGVPITLDHLDFPVETTNERTSTLKGREWVKYRPCRKAAHDGRTWVFSDGSSTGFHSAVIVHDRGKVVRRLTRLRGPDHTRNVGAELDGALLGLEHCAPGSKVVLVSDFLGVAAWFTGAWSVRDQAVADRVVEARTIVTEKKLSLTFVHHAGHQRDDSDLTRWNAEADRLCSGKKAKTKKATETTDDEDSLSLRQKTPKKAQKPKRKTSTRAR